MNVAFETGRPEIRRSVQDRKVPRVPLPELVAVVDEDARSARRVEAFLRSVGLRVMRLGPREAAPAIRAVGPDVLVAQHGMERLAALDLFALARSVEAARRPGLVLLADDPSSLTLSDLALADAVASRPASPPDLMRAIRAALRRKIHHARRPRREEPC